MGLVFRWARLAALAPGLANLVTRAPVVREFVKEFTGFCRERAVPALAPQTFRDWFQNRPESDRSRPRLLLWADTFNNYFTPHAAQAAVEVLEAAGYRVELPPRVLCCGRPLYDYGMLDLAKRKLRQTLDSLRPALTSGQPIVVLEPSCAAVFRDELINLFPDDEDAQRLSRQCVLLSELLDNDKRYTPPPLRGRALMHAHCHHKAIMGTQAETRLLRAMGLELQCPETGCCGLAGSFGYEREHYELSMRIGERVLLPAVREAAQDTLIIADGFSCRSQIEHATARRALHFAEVLQLALREGRSAWLGAYPERRYAQAAAAVTPAEALVLGLLGAAALGALVALARPRRH